MKEIQINVLDKGYISLVDFLGDDYRILQSARISTGGEAQKGDKEDRGLIRYLYKNKHLSPFEMVSLTFRMKCPILTMRQFVRHRTFKINEYSQRYSPAIEDMYMPEHLRVQGVKNHQGSGENIDETKNEELSSLIQASYDANKILYNHLLEQGVAKELARTIIPVSNYTEIYFTADLRNLFHFLNLRLHPHAQYEIRVYAEAILQILKQLPQLKWSVEIFEEMNEIDYLILDCISKNKDLTKFKKNLINFLGEE